MSEPTLLRLSRVIRVDLVDKGASYDPLTGEGAHVLIHKRAPVVVQKKIEQRGDQWCVLDADGEKVLGCHDSEAKAKAQLAAVESNKDKPAEKRWSRWLGIAKALGILKDEYGAAPAKTFEQAFLARTMYEVTNCLGDAFGALYESIEGAIRSDQVADKAGAIRAAVESFNATVQAKVEEWLDGPVVSAAAGGDGEGGEYDEYGVEKIGRKIAGARLTRMKAAYDALGTVIREADGEGQSMTDTKKVDLSTLPELVRKHVEGLQAEVATLTEKCAGLEKKIVAPPDPWAGVEPSVRKRMEAQDAEITNLREANAQTVYVGKAAAFKGLPVKADDDWSVLRAIDAIPDEKARKRVWELLRAGDAAMTTGVLKQVGSDAPASIAGGDAWAKIEAGAKDLVAKSAGKVSDADGVTKFMETPDGKRLYAEYLGQNPAQTGGR